MKTTRLICAILLTAFFGGCALDGEHVDSSNAEVGGHPSFEVFEGGDDQYYFHLLASNHEIVLASEGYTRRLGALGGVLSVLDNAGFRGNYEVEAAASGGFYFNLRAANGQVIGTSEVYASRDAADRGVAATIRAVADYLEYRHQRRGARFDVFEGADGRFYFNLRAANGAIVLQSEGYSSEAAALNGTFSVADHGVDVDRYDLREAGSGGFYFNLVASNGQVIGTSEVYSTLSNARRARNGVIDLLPEIELL